MRCCRRRVGRGAGRGSQPATNKIRPCDQRPKCSQAVLCPSDVCPASAPYPASARVATSFEELWNTTAGSRLANPSCGVDGSAREPRLRKWARPQPSQPGQGVVRRAGQVGDAVGANWRRHGRRMVQKQSQRRLRGGSSRARICVFFNVLWFP